jgi:hypothetical protein
MIISLNGEYGSSINFELDSTINLDKSVMLMGNVSIKASWYSANLPVVFTGNKVGNFIKQIEQGILLQSNKVLLFDEFDKCNFEFKPYLTGKVVVKGNMSPDMETSEQLCFEVQTYLPNVEQFATDLKRLLM